MKVLQTIAAVLATCLSFASQATVLDFSGDICSNSPTFDGSGPMIPCSNGSRINQAYGDSPEVNVTWDDRFNSVGRSILYWQGGYSGLSHVAYSVTDPTVRLQALDGNAIHLSSFVLGAYVIDRTTQYTIIDLADGGIVAQALNLVVLNSTPYLVQVERTSTAGFLITFGPDGNAVGIDNITFTATPVPEASNLAMACAGLALLALRRRLR